MRLKRTAILLPFAALLAACEPQPGPYYPTNSYPSQPEYIQYGTIIQVRPVTMQRTANGDQIVGAVTGGLVGAIIGSQFGAGTGKDLMTGAGAITGAVIGSNIATHQSTYQSAAWTVRLDSGGVMTIIQTSGRFHVGDRVMVVQSGNETYLQ
ncbi:MAG: glycine zipper 2TM domain-containing protein [Rhodobacteraceae bacterium]|nr:glycine zipper 2TM domain-containing protein [Paracoccaceae bacterium]